MREALDKIRTIAKRENREDTFILLYVLSFILREIILAEKSTSTESVPFSRSVSDLAMAWCLADPRVVSIIPGEIWFL